MGIYALHHILWKVVILFINQMQKSNNKQCFQYKVRQNRDTFRGKKSKYVLRKGENSFFFHI